MATLLEDTWQAKLVAEANAWADHMLTRDDFDLEAWIVGPLHKELTVARSQAARARSRIDAEKSLRDIVTKSLRRDYNSEIFAIASSDPDSTELILSLPAQRSLKVDTTFMKEGCDAAAIRGRVELLANTRDKFADIAGYTFLYVTTNEVATAAHEHDPDLWEWAFERKVILGSAFDFFGALDAVKKAWDDYMRDEERRARLAAQDAIEGNA